MVIDCDRCRMRDVACRDCVVTVLLELPDAGERLELDVVEARAISALAGSGLVPPLRLVPTSPPDRPALSEQPGRADQPGRQDQPRRPHQPGRQDQPALQDQHGRPQQPGRSDRFRGRPEAGGSGTYDVGHGAGASRAG